MPGDAFLSQQLYLVNYDFELYANFTLFLNDSINGDQIRQKEDRSIFGYQGRYQQKQVLGPFLFTGTAGWGLRYDQIRDNELSRTLQRKQTLSRLSLGDIHELNAFAYLEENVRCSKRWTIDLGLRLDFLRAEYYDKLAPTYQTQAAQRAIPGPKFNITYDWRPNFQWFFKSGIGFHSNDTRVIVAQHGRQIMFDGDDRRGAWFFVEQREFTEELVRPQDF